MTVSPVIKKKRTNLLKPLQFKHSAKHYKKTLLIAQKAPLQKTPPAEHLTITLFIRRWLFIRVRLVPRRETHGQDTCPKRGISRRQVPRRPITGDRSSGGSSQETGPQQTRPQKRHLPSRHTLRTQVLRRRITGDMSPANTSKETSPLDTSQETCP